MRLFGVALCGVLLGACSGDSAFYQDYAHHECALYAACWSDFSDYWEDAAECEGSRGGSGVCEVVDFDAADRCLMVLESLTCDDLNEGDALPVLLDCSSAQICMNGR